MDIHAGQVYSLTQNDSVMAAVLAVTNLGLKPKIAAEHPPVVVYVNDRGAIRSLVATSFLERWEFTGSTVAKIASADMSAAFLGWIDGDQDDVAHAELVDASEQDDEEDEGDVDGDGDDDNDNDNDNSEEVEEVEDVDVSQIEAFRTGSFAASAHTADDGPTLSCGPHPMRDRLESAFLSYSVRPMLSGDGKGFPVHCLEFLVSDQLQITDIEAAFNPVNDNIVDVFTVGDIKVDWEGYSGVYPTMQAGLGTIATVWLTSAMDMDAPTDGPIPSEPATEGNGAVAVQDAPANVPAQVDIAQAEVQFVTVS